MTERNRLDVPNLAIDISEKVQDWAVVRAIRKALVDTDSPAFKRAKWHSVEDVVDVEDEPFSLPIAEADWRTNVVHAVFRRLMSRAVVFGVDPYALDEIQAKNGGEVAVAYTYRNKSHAGILPNGARDLGRSARVGYLELAAIREGPNDFGVGLGMFIPEQKKLVAPRDQRIVEQHVPIHLLPDYYPGTSLF